MAPPAPRTARVTRLQASGSAKRKRDTPDTEPTTGSIKEDTSSTRKTKAVKVSPVQKNKVTGKADSANESSKLYTDTVKALEKDVTELDKRIGKVGLPGYGQWFVTSSNYAQAAREHLPAVKKLASMNCQMMALHLLMAIADASHTDLDATAKMCGMPDDESTPTFRMLDEVLLGSIGAIEIPAAGALVGTTQHLEVRKRWTLEDADVGVVKNGNPNKKQRTEMAKQRLV